MATLEISMPIYVHRNNQRLGPYTAAEVKSQFANGALSINDHVWWQGQTDWVPLGESALMSSGFQDIPGPEKPAPPPRTGLSQFAVAALVTGCISLIVWIFTSVFAVVFGHIALHEIKQNPGLKGRGLAIAGLILGYIMTLLSVAVIASYIIYMPDIARITDQQQARDEASGPNLPTTSVPRIAPPKPSPSVPVTNSAPAGAVSGEATNSADLSVTPPSPMSSPEPGTPTPMLNTNSVPITNAAESSTNAAPISP